MRAFLGCVVAVALAACGEPSTPLVTDSPVGSWRMEDPGAYAEATARAYEDDVFSRPQSSLPPAFDVAEAKADMERHVTTFGTDGTFTDAGPRITVNGRWRRDGNAVHVVARPAENAPEFLIDLEMTPGGFFLVAPFDKDRPKERFRLVRTDR